MLSIQKLIIQIDRSVSVCRLNNELLFCSVQVSHGDDSRPPDGAGRHEAHYGAFTAPAAPFGRRPSCSAAPLTQLDGNDEVIITTHESALINAY